MARMRSIPAKRPNASATVTDRIIFLISGILWGVTLSWRKPMPNSKRV